MLKVELEKKNTVERQYGNISVRFEPTVDNSESKLYFEIFLLFGNKKLETF